MVDSPRLTPRSERSSLQGRSVGAVIVDGVRSLHGGMKLSADVSSTAQARQPHEAAHADTATSAPSAATISSTFVFASPKSIWVFSRKKSGFWTPA